MKRLFIILFLTIFALTGCKKEVPPPVEEPSDIELAEEAAIGVGLVK
jgi:hypothetical protein